MNRILITLGALVQMALVVYTSDVTHVYIGCQCENKTLQQQFCDDEFVITVIVLNQIAEASDSEPERKFQTYVIKNHKVNDNIKQWDSLDVYTNATNLTCGVDLTPKQHYTLGDGKHWVSLCNVVIAGYDLPCQYDCDCKVTHGQCTGSSCPPEKDTCHYIPPSEGSLQTNRWEDVCRRDQNGVCQWAGCV